jgi:hypothetical protein
MDRENIAEIVRGVIVVSAIAGILFLSTRPNDSSAGTLALGGAVAGYFGLAQQPKDKDRN